MWGHGLQSVNELCHSVPGHSEGSGIEEKISLCKCTEKHIEGVQTVVEGQIGILTAGTGKDSGWGRCRDRREKALSHFRTSFWTLPCGPVAYRTLKVTPDERI